MFHNPLPFFVIIPLFAAFLNSLLGKKFKFVSDVLSALATLSLAGIAVYSIFVFKQEGVFIYKMGGWHPLIGISLVMDGLSLFMLTVVNFIAFLVSIYSIDYMEKYEEKWNFYSLFLLMVSGMNGVIVSGDIFNLYIFMEITAISAYSLVAFGTNEEELEAAFKYIIMGAIASAFILLGIALVYGAVSTLNMADIGMELAKKNNPNFILFVSVLFLAGFGLKAALAPFHGWLPDAHSSSPACVSAMLSGVIIKTLGVYTIIRIFFNVIGVNQNILNMFMALGAFSMILGGVSAFGQKDMKRLLAYSSISQIGYIFIGLGTGNPLGIIGAMFHLMNHSIFKSLLFLNAGAVEYATGLRSMVNLGGLKDKMPVTAKTSLIASMSISGIPPFSGFWSKLLIICACIQAKHFGYAFTAVLISIVTLAYFMKLQKHVFYGNIKEKFNIVKDVPVFMRFSMVVLAVLCVIGGVMLVPFIYDNFLKSAGEVIGNGKEYANSIFALMK